MKNKIHYDIIDINEEKFKNYLKSNPKEIKDIIIDCYGDYATEFYPTKQKLIDFCINSGILRKNNQIVKQIEIETNTSECLEDCQINKQLCKGHESNYSSHGTVLCTNCQNWCGTSMGFYHCCCYIYEDNSCVV